MRRTPEPTELSLSMTNRPISAVVRTWGPPHRAREPRAHLPAPPATGAQIGARPPGRDRLDAADAGADRALAEHDERADLRGRAHVGPSAKLPRDALDLDDAHLVAVLLAEEHH